MSLTAGPPTLKVEPELSPSTGEPLAVTVQLPPDRPDYAGDLLTGGIGILGGLLGAVAGAYAAYRWGLKAAQDAKDRDAKERNSHHGFSLIHKLNRIYSAQKQIRVAIEAGVERLAVAKAQAEAEGRRAHDHLSLEVRPFSTSLSRVHFTADEVMAAGRVGGQDALQIVMVLDERHNTTADLLDQYRQAKLEFQGMSTALRDFDAERGYAQLGWTEEQYKEAQPHLFVMDATVRSLLKHTKQDERSTYDAILAVLIGRAKAEGATADYRVPDPDGKKMKVTSAGVEDAPIEEGDTEGQDLGGAQA